MALALAFTGRPTLRRRWTATLAATGFNGADNPADYRFWLGINSNADVPEKPSDLDGYHVWLYTHRPGGGIQTVQNTAPDGSVRLILQIQVDPGFFEDATRSSRFWAGFSLGEDEDDDFLAVSGPRMGG